MKRILLWLVLASALVLGFVAYRSLASRNHLNVTPDVHKEIEKARRR